MLPLRRLLLSITGGIFIPIALLLLLIGTEGIGLTLPSWLQDVIIFMIYWPLILISKFAENPLALPGGDQPRTGVFVAWMFIHFLSFASITYFILWFRDRKKWK